MNQTIEFDVTLWTSEDYPNSAALTFPYNAVEVFGTKGRVPVKLTIGEHTFRSSLAPMEGKHMMVFNLEMRQKTGYKAGDTIHVILEKDIEPREITFPEDVTEVIQTNPAAYKKLLSYSYSHKKEVMDWINDAKKPETRQKRIKKLLETL
jgi:hypothetical protein